MNTEAVTVVMPTFNGAAYVAEALTSVYEQTLCPREVIVVDDGSTDETCEVVRQFDDHPGFRLCLQTNQGAASARNHGIRQATTSHIAFLDQDDLWRPRKLERQLEEFEPSLGMSFTAFEHTTPTASKLMRHESWDPESHAVMGVLERENPFPPSTVLVRRDVIEGVGGFEDANFSEDWLTWLRIAAAGHPIGYLDEPLTEYRWHGGNPSDIDRAMLYERACTVFDRYGDRRLRSLWRLHAAVYAHQSEDRRTARQRILQAAIIHPLSARPGWAKLLF